MKSSFCDPQMNGTTSGCPCETCIVKPVCTTDICEEMNNFYRGIFGFDHEDYTKEEINHG